MSDEQRTPAESGERNTADTGIIRETVYKRPASREQVPATETVQAELREVTATTVLMDRSGSEHITAERVNLDRSGAKTIDTKSAQLDRSGVVALGSDNAVLLHSSAVQVVADEVRMSKSMAFVVSSGNATIEDSRVLIFAGQANGDVQALMTSRSAAILGGAAGLVLSLMLILLRSGSRSGGE
jgi:3D (Asp-Asp-Asp) domain-containing protein